MKKEERIYLDDNAHDFHIHIANECGVGYNEFRTFLDNLDDEQILESIDTYVELKLKEQMEKQTETKSQLQEQLEANVNLEAVGLYRDLLRNRLHKSAFSGESVEEEVKNVGKAVDAFKKYFLG